MSGNVDLSLYRKNIITYLLTVSSFQERIEQLQQKLLNHIQFNPGQLFEYVTGRSHQKTIPIKEFRERLAEKLKIKSGYGIMAYLHKYQQKQEKSSTMNLQMFLNTIVPYNPSVLRQSQYILTKNIQLGLQDYFPSEKQEVQNSEATFKGITKLYRQMATLDIHHVLALQSLKEELLLQWPTVKKTILKDLRGFTKISQRDSINNETLLKGQLTLNKVRKWFQLFTNRLSKIATEKDMLKISRWCQGVDQVHLKKLFDSLQHTRHTSNSKRCMSAKSRSQSKKKLQKLRQIKKNDLFIAKETNLKNGQIKSEYYVDASPQKVYNQASRSTLENRKPTKSYSEVNLHKNRHFIQHQSHSINRNQGIQFDLESEQVTNAMFQKWLTYIKILIDSEKSIELLRSSVKVSKSTQSTLEILFNESMKPFLKVEQLIQFVEKYLSVNSDEKTAWIAHFSELKIFKNQLRRIINGEKSDSNQKQSKYGNSTLNVYQDNQSNSIGINAQNEKSHKKSIGQVIAHILLLFISTRYELGILAQILEKGARQIFRRIDITHSTYVNRKTLNSFLQRENGKTHINGKIYANQPESRLQNSYIRKKLELTRYKFTETDTTLLLEYFGDGRIITEASLQRMITIEALGQFHNR